MGGTNHSSLAARLGAAAAAESRVGPVRWQFAMPQWQPELPDGWSKQETGGAWEQHARDQMLSEESPVL